ncbi:NAD(+)/NADH kinase [Borrelia sp. BU AG58]|uniref:NAD(+)/NADH kinase n=1 Tax=Borrelia sp. BU AG58 TaxID=2887345 RepID=UPI001E5FCBDA|nr:NAD(+)/NADH kinase [Borrelia sp. BU AG58]UER67498.1 NAD(+)/NADH kinase [Borrelia sp. BU AG58]
MEGRVLIYVNYSNLHAEFLGCEIQEYLKDKYGVLSLLAGADKNLDLLASDLIFAMTLGGDGTVLLASSLLLKNNIDVPIISINLGKVGFLADIKPRDFKEVIDKFFDNSLVIHERYLLSVSAYENGRNVLTEYALNDVIIRSSILNKLICVDLRVNAEDFLSYRSDGIIFATPTGSTGYSFSAGGSILESDLKAFILTPISPHSVYNRSFVFSVGSKVTLSFQKQCALNPVSIFVDGVNLGKFEVDIVFEVSLANKSLRFASFCTDTFVKRLKNKLL